MISGAASGRSRSAAPADPHRIKLYWLLKLHWGAIIGQVAAVLALPPWVGIELPIAPLLGIVVLQGVAMLCLDVWSRRATRVREETIAALMLFDAAVLTGMLLLAGGYANPFSMVYLVNVALAAVMLRRPAWAWALAGISLLGFGFLFIFGGPGGHHVALPEMQHDQLLVLHMRGMWVALGVSAIFIVYIVQRVTRELEAREAELAAERSLAGRREKITSLATLAAGAAHELSTPLSVIAVVTRELQRSLADAPDAQEDLQLIKQQLARCQDILQHMAAHAGENAGEPFVSLSLATWAETALDGLPGNERVSLRADVDLAEHWVRGPTKALSRALRSLLKNALQASPGHEPVELWFRIVGGEISAEVSDRGPGIAPDVLARVGEPFFTTKVPGEGMGLGLFLTRALAEQLGGSLELESAPGKGTTARLRLPAALAFKTGAAA
jgi:two-component system sensor histidine kinase RegB